MRERKKEITPAETKVCHGQLTRTEHSYAQNPELKRTIKTVAIIKTKENTKINQLLPEDDLKRQKYVMKKNI